MKRRFTDRDSILLAIDRLNASSVKRALEAEHHGSEADRCFKQSAIEKNPKDSNWLIEQGEEHRVKERKLIRIGNRFPGKMEKLKRTLAAFDTETLFAGDDKSIAMQK